MSVVNFQRFLNYKLDIWPELINLFGFNFVIYWSFLELLFEHTMPFCSKCISLVVLGFFLWLICLFRNYVFCFLNCIDVIFCGGSLWRKGFWFIFLNWASYFILITLLVDWTWIFIDSVLKLILYSDVWFLSTDSVWVCFDFCFDWLYGSLFVNLSGSNRVGIVLVI